MKTQGHISRISNNRRPFPGSRSLDSRVEFGSLRRLLAWCRPEGLSIAMPKMAGPSGPSQTGDPRAGGNPVRPRSFPHPPLRAQGGGGKLGGWFPTNGPKPGPPDMADPTTHARRMAQAWEPRCQYRRRKQPQPKPGGHATKGTPRADAPRSPRGPQYAGRPCSPLPNGRRASPWPNPPP